MAGASAQKTRRAGRGAIELVVFDCDGVLVDSEPLAIDVLRESVAELGVAVDRASAYRDFLGRSLTAVSHRLQADYGVAFPPEAIAAMRERLFARYRAALKPMEGVAAMLARLEQRACVASSSQLERIRISLELTGLYEAFAPDIFSATMVENGKPEPDLFLYAARKMGADPARCVVIEDSPAGIRAARAAGMRVIAFTGGSHVQPANLGPVIAGLAPDFTLGDFHTLPDLLHSLENEIENG